MEYTFKERLKETTIPLFFINLISNHLCLGEIIFTSQPTLVVWAQLICVSALFTLIEGAIIATCYAISTRLGIVIGDLVYAISLVLFAVDCFLYTQFKLIIGQNAINILQETNTDEAKGFILSYINWKTALALASPFIALTISKISKKLSRFRCCRFTIYSLAILGFLFSIYCVDNHRRGGSSHGIVLMVSPLRTAVPFYHNYSINRQLPKLAQACQRTNECKKVEGSTAFKDIIIVLGESNSLYHTSLYSYEKETFPYMKSLDEKDSLFVFYDVCAPCDVTHGVMKPVFSTDVKDFFNKPLFPALLRESGYSIQLLDNQYFVGKGVDFLVDEKLSDILFDSRNSDSFGYDGNMLEAIIDTASHNVNILHIMGQHYHYADRFPPEFAVFTANDYDPGKYTIEQREMIAAYDNTCLYTDQFLKQLIERYQDRDAILVYLSDHGEELYELSNFHGHGTAINSSDIRYQIRVPFFIWMSETARLVRPELCDRLREAKDLPIITSDFAHFILDLAGYSSDYTDAKRSFISPDYDVTKPRIVLGNIDYDEYCRTHPHK